jgi:hypothetical protein
MTGQHRARATSPTTTAARLALAGAAVSLGALALAGQAAADPGDPGAPGDPSLVISNPGAPPPPPGQPVQQAADGGPAPAPPPPVGTETVPELAPGDQHYGSGSGPLGFLRDAWHQARDPSNFGGTDGEMPMAAAPPPGAGPAPKLPPGYISTNAPGSETPMPAADPNAPKPPPPPGYVRMEDGRLAPDPNGPPPPAPGTAGAAAAPAYVPRHSPPPPPLLPEDPGPPPF